VGADQVDLKLGEMLRSDAHVGEVAEAGVDAVDGPAASHRFVDRTPRGFDAALGSRRQRASRSERDFFDRFQRQRVPVDDDGRTGRGPAHSGDASSKPLI
jgi:hypothetical protein